MNKKLKIKIIIILLILIAIIKIIQINFIENIRIKVHNFEELENTYYNQSSRTGSQKVEITKISKNGIIKEIDDFISINNKIVRYINLENSKVITIDNKYNTYKIENYSEICNIRLKNLPRAIDMANDIKNNFQNGNIFSIFNCIRILYIVPTKYNDVDCYKIKTTRELLYVDKETLYPIYLEYYKNNSNNDKEKVIIEYTFEENNVTDADVKIPNLDNYTLIEN